MKLKREYIGRYLHDIATQQIADEYEAKGYSVSLEEKIGEIRTDIVARKDGEVVVIEIKAGRLSAERKKEIANLSNFIQKEDNHKFSVVFVNPLQEKKLEIDNFEELLFDYFQNNLPDELSILSSNTRFAGFEYLILDEVNIQDSQILVKGDGLVNINLEYGKEAKDGLVLEDAYPFNFDISLMYNTKESKLDILELNSLEVDTSSFYE